MALNKEALAEIFQQTPTSEAFATYAACRERNAKDGVSRVPGIRAQMEKEGFEPIPQDMLAMFRALEKAGIGKLEGDLFKWRVPIRKLGKIAVEAALVKPKKLEAGPVKSELRAPAKEPKSLVIVFDSKREISISFTDNLGKDEIGFIASRLLKECQG